MVAFLKIVSLGALSATALISLSATANAQEQAAPPQQTAAAAEATPAVDGQAQLAADIEVLTASATAVAEEADAPVLIVSEPIELDPAEPVGPIVLRGTDIPQVLDLIQKYSGRIMIVSDDLPKNKVSFNSDGPMPREQAIYALENLLSLNGVMLVRGEGKFVRASAMRDPARRATPLLETLPQSGQSGQVFTKVFQLKYVTPQQVYNLVRNFTSGNNTSRIQRFDASNSIMVVDTLNNLRAIETLIKQVDQPSESTSRIYTFSVRHGDAARIRDTLRQIQRSSFAPWLGDASLWVDARTNKLVIVTRPENHALFEDLIDDLDEEVAPFTTSKVITIKEGNFWSIWNIARGMVRNQRRQFDRQGFRSTEQTVERTQGATEEEAAAAAAQGATAQTEAAAPTVDVTVTETLMMEAGMPELQFSPYVEIFPDYSNNALVVYGTHSDIARMEKLISQLDIKAAPYVTSEIVEIKHAHTRDLSQLLTFLINTQRNTFARKGFRTATGGDQPEGAASDTEGSGFQFSDFATIAADWRRNSILIYGTRQDIAQLQELIAKIDQPSAPITRNEVLYLKHARADTLVRMVTGVINYQRNTFSRTRNLSQVQSDAATAEGGVSNFGFEFSDYAVVYADRRSNALFIYGTDSDIERVRLMTADADIPVEPMTQTRIFALRHTDANQSASIIQRIVNAQRQALRQVRSEGREVANPAATAANADSGEAGPTADGVISDGQEALQFSPFMTVTPDVRSNSLVVYGTHGDIEQIDELLKQIDIQVSPFTQSRVFFLKNAQSNSLVGILTNVVRGQERALSRVRSRNREIQNTRGVGNLGTGAEDSALQFSPYVTIVENRRNNAIIVYGTPTDIAQIGDLIAHNDVAIAPYTQTRTFDIHHADATDIARTITTLINQQQRVREREATLQRVFRRSGGSANEGEDDGAGADSAAGAAVNAVEDVMAAADSFDPNAGADLQFSPYVSLVADDRSNSVIAYGTQFDLNQIGNLIEQIDTVLPQVRIEVVIAEVRLQDNQVSGLSSFGVNYRNPFDFQRVSQTTGGVTNEQIMGTTGIHTGMMPLTSGDSQGAFDLGLSLNDFSLTTVFRVAQENANVKVLSAPTITTTHNRRAQINVGEARPIITGTTTSGSSDLVTRSTVEYRDIGITLRVRPLVSESGAIQMELEQIVETVIGEQTIDRNVQPIISTRRASSFVSVRDREIIIMGGLQSVETTKREGKVFLLGDIPLLGELFRPEREEEVVRELIIFIRPYLVTSSSEEHFIEENELENKAIGKDIKHYLETGRFPEQDRLLSEQKETDENDESAKNKPQQEQPQQEQPQPSGSAKTDATPADATAPADATSADAPAPATPDSPAAPAASPAAAAEPNAADAAPAQDSSDKDAPAPAAEPTRYRGKR